MEVFVIPVGSDRYELYYEQTTALEPDEEPQATGLIARLQSQFDALLRKAEEHHRRRGEKADTPQSWMGRMQDRMLSWIAERIAEQRLLWNLRKQDTAVAIHPRDTNADQVLAQIQRVLQRDYERHRFWLAIDAVGLVLSWPLTVIPGPNVLLFYFLFRVGGHYMSMRGANRGRRRVAWTCQPNDVLVGLRAALSLRGPDRHQRIQEIESELHLRNLHTFVDRVSRPKRSEK